QLEITEFNIAIAAQHFIMIASNIYDTCSRAQHADDLFDYLHVCCRKIALAELPAIDNVPVEDEDLWRNAFKIVDDLLRMAAVSAKVEIRQYNYIDSSFLHSEGFTNFDNKCD